MARDSTDFVFLMPSDGPGYVVGLGGPGYVVGLGWVGLGWAGGPGYVVGG